MPDSDVGLVGEAGDTKGGVSGGGKYPQLYLLLQLVNMTSPLDLEDTVSTI